MAKTNMIVLKTCDNNIFEIEEIVAKQCETLNLIITDQRADTTIPLPNITGGIFTKIIEYCKRHAIPLNEEEEMEKIELKKFDEKFVDVDPNILYDLYLAANYLEIKSLLKLISRTIAAMIRDQTPEEIRELLNIKNDFTEEEEQEFRRKNAWAFP